MKWPLQSAMALLRDEIVKTPVAPAIVQPAVRDSVARVLPCDHAWTFQPTSSFDPREPLIRMRSGRMPSGDWPLRSAASKIGRVAY
jgi:hypothetical protein